MHKGKSPMKPTTEGHLLSQTDFFLVSHHHPAPSTPNLLRPGPTSDMKVNVYKQGKMVTKSDQV